MAIAARTVVLQEEAVECCRWLRDAGFPQYARLYEEHKFPIDIRSVHRDHEFLDVDSLRALFRRLNALNRCAIMKVENVVLRKHSDQFHLNPLETDIDDEMTAGNFDDDDDQVAISNKWRYQRKSQTWSRIACDEYNDESLHNEKQHQQQQQQHHLFQQQQQRIAADERLRIATTGYLCDLQLPQMRQQPVAATKNDRRHNGVIAREEQQQSSEKRTKNRCSTNLQRSQSERLKERARALMKRMDIRSSSRRRREQHRDEAASGANAAAAAAAKGRSLVIGDPVLVSHFSASPRTMRMFPDGLCGILSSQAVTPAMLDQFRSASEERSTDGLTFAMLQPSMRSSDDTIALRSGRVTNQLGDRRDPNSANRVTNARRMGMVLMSPASDPSLSPPSAAIASNAISGVATAAAGIALTSDDYIEHRSSSSGSSAIERRHQNRCCRRPRDMSCDASLIRNAMSPHLDTYGDGGRFVDASALDFDDLHLDIYDVHPERFECFRNGAAPSGNAPIQSAQSFFYDQVATIGDYSSLNRSSVAAVGGIKSNTSGIHSDISLNPPELLHDSASQLQPAQRKPSGYDEFAIEHITAIRGGLGAPSRSRLIVNADGYYEHIPDGRDVSLERNVVERINSGNDSNTSLYHCAISPASSSSNASVLHMANRLKVEIDAHGRRLNCSASPPEICTQQSHSSLESSGNDDELRHRKNCVAERRDSGVGSSLSRSPSGPTTQRQRSSLLLSAVNCNSGVGSLRMRDVRHKLLSPSTGAFRTDQSETFISDADLTKCMDALTVTEMQRMRKLAFLKLSVMIETYAGNGVRIGVAADSNVTNANVKSWAVHKFIRRMRNIDSKPQVKGEVFTFGLPLAIVQGRCGFALPRCILEIMRFLRTVAPDTVGIFRKSGVRSRIAELRALCDVAPETEVFPDGKHLDPTQVHDIADLLKQYFRELPEPLMTAKYSEAFANIFLYIPTQMRLEALQHAMLLLPDEHREALQTLLYFLHDIAKHSATNSMTPQNLAVCFAPSLFQLCGSRLNHISPTRRHKTIGASGLPTEREIKESRAAQECLVVMIEQCTTISIVPSSPGFERDLNSYGCEPDAPFLTELGLSDEGNYKTYLLQRARELIKEHRDRWKGWIVEGTVNDVEISTKKPCDGHPLRFYRVWVDVEAPPRELVARIIRERSFWDTQVINWRTVATLNAENCDVFQYVINDTPAHPTRDVMVVRLWRTEMKELRGGCVLVERSVHSSETQLLGGLPAAILASQFLVEPIVGRSRVTYISRVDLRGRSNVWYSKVYGQLIARKLATLRDTFKQITRVEGDGPETKL